MPRVRPAFVFPLLALAACASAPEAGRRLPAGWQAESGNALVHRPTGLVFPAEWNGLTRVAPHTHDADGSDVPVAYEGLRYHTHLTLDIQAKTADEPDQAAAATARFDESVLEMLDAHEGTTVHEASAMNLPFGHGARMGFGAYLSWPEGDAQTGAFVVLVPFDEHFYRTRVRIQLDGTQEPVAYGWQTLLDFLRTLEPPTSG